MEDKILSYSTDPQLWLYSVSITFFIVFFIILVGYKLPNDYKKILTKILGFLFLARLVFLHGYMVGIGHWEITNSLPLHLCGINSILCIILMFRYNQSMFEYLALLGIPSAFHSILTPQFINGWDGYYFPEFYLSHGSIFLAPLFLTIVNGHKLRKDSWKTSFLNGIYTVILIGLINCAIGYFSGTMSNYMYTFEAPEADNPLIITKIWPIYYLILISFTFIHILIVHRIYNIFGKVFK